MYKLYLFAICLALQSVDLAAMPRELAPEESKIEFVVKEMGVPVAGQFKRFEAVIDIDSGKLEQSHITMRIDIGSLTTGNEEADSLAIGADWLDRAHAPFGTFKSSAIRALGGGRYEAKGTLNIRNRARDIVFQFSSIDQPSGKTVVAGDFVIKRSEFGIGGGEWNQAGVVAEEIPVKVRLTLAPPAANGVSRRPR
jgi:polyisoprenoid-binding protein YceI